VITKKGAGYGSGYNPVIKPPGYYITYDHYFYIVSDENGSYFQGNENTFPITDEKNSIYWNNKLTYSLYKAIIDDITDEYTKKEIEAGNPTIISP